jgi:hypothetical protein
MTLRQRFLAALQCLQHDLERAFADRALAA